MVKFDIVKPTLFAICLFIANDFHCKINKRKCSILQLTFLHAEWPDLSSVKPFTNHQCFQYLLCNPLPTWIVHTFQLYTNCWLRYKSLTQIHIATNEMLRLKAWDMRENMGAEVKKVLRCKRMKMLPKVWVSCSKHESWEVWTTPVLPL